MVILILSKKSTVYDPNDIARTTIKETNIHDTRYTRNNIKRNNQDNKQKIYQQDKVRPTIRNTVEEVDKTINLQGNQKQTVYDPNDVPEQQLKIQIYIMNVGIWEYLEKIKKMVI